MELNALYVLSAVLVCVLVRFLQGHWTLRIIWMTWSIPGPTSYPIVGQTVHLIGPTDYVWKQLRKFAKLYPRFLKIWGGNRCGIFIQQPDDIDALLSSPRNLQKSEVYDLVSLWLGSGLLVSSGKKWKSRRRILTPAFHFNILKGFVDIFEKESQHSLKTIALKSNNNGTNVIPIVTEHALYSLCETTMGVQIDPKSPEIKTYKAGINEFGQMFMERVMKPWLYTQWVYNLTAVGSRMVKTIDTLQKFTRRVLQERLDSWDNSVIRSVESASGKQKLPMMDLLISQMKQGADIDYEGIREEVDTFMFEGHDTTSMSLSLFLMLLANHPEVQDRIYQEQLEIFGSTKRQASYDDLQKMTYLEMAIREGLRVYPAVPIIGRTLEEDLILDGGVVFPAGILVYVMIYDLHHNPKYWPNPEKFDPDRFLPENSVNRHPFSYIPFSAGSRNCIGQRFAILEIKSFVSTVLREYTLEPIDTPETIVLKADLVIRPVSEVRVRFQRRKMG